MRSWLLIAATAWWSADAAGLRGHTGRRMSGESFGDVWILLDFTVAAWARRAQQRFAADLVGNASSEAGSDWHLSFGVVIFHENASYELELSDAYAELQAELLDPYFAENFTNFTNVTNVTNHSELSIWPPSWWNDWNHTWDDWRFYEATGNRSWLPRNSHLALEICDDFLFQSYYSAVVLLTNGSAADWWRTMRAADRLKAKDALIYAIGLDEATERSWNRTQELYELASNDATHYAAGSYQFDALLRPPHHGASSLRRLVTTTPLGQLAELLAQDVVQQLTWQKAEDLAMSTGQPQTSAEASFTSTFDDDDDDDEGEPLPPSSGGLAGGIVVLIVLLSCCCVCSMIGVAAFYFYQQEQKRKTAVSPSPVVPVSPSAEPPPPAPKPSAPTPKDATQKGLQEAIDMKDLEKLCSLLSELLLQGWPEERYADLILKALDTVASLKSSTTSRLEAAVARGDPLSSLAVERLSGVEPQLLRKAEELREDVMS